MAEDFRMMPMSSRVAQGDTAVLKCLAPRLEIIMKMMMRVVTGVVVMVIMMKLVMKMMLMVVKMVVMMGLRIWATQLS